MTQQKNGQDHGTGHIAEIATVGPGLSAADDIKAMAAQIRDSETVIERVRDAASPFEQKSHTLMIESVDRITQEWVAELATVRENTKLIEQMVIEQAAKVKTELTKMHLLGVQAMREAQRGNEVMHQLGDQLDAMMTEHSTH
jgi:hypothetical protein